jgi:hypothetical protein
MKIEATEVASAEPATVFQTLTNFEDNLKRWTRGVVSVQLVADVGELPAYHIKGRNVGLKTTVAWRYEVTTYEPHRRFAGRARGGPVPFTEEFLLEPVPEGTRITHTQDIEPTARFRLVSPLLKLAWSKVIQQNLGRLKKLVEEQTAASAGRSGGTAG